MTDPMRATARACSNIAFVKYWGKADARENVPLNGSVSMALSAATTTTTVQWDPDLREDEVYLDGERVLDGRALRVSRYLDRLRALWYRLPARVVSVNSFPAATGIASSASAFAALAVAAIGAFGEGLPDTEEMSRWARRGSGSACRSIHGGFVQWIPGTDDAGSFARPLCPPEHWDLRDIVAVVSSRPKELPSSEAHRAATAHPFMPARQAQLPSRILALMGAVTSRDFATFGEIVEQEAMEVHALAMSGRPGVLYLQPLTVALIHELRAWREGGLPVCFTLDAGPNLHVLCEGGVAADVLDRLRQVTPRIDLIHNRPGPGTRLIDEHLC